MDQRIKITKNMLKSSLIELLTDKQLADITITELCKKASINRNTFYSHFDSVHDLYKEMEEQLITDIQSTLTKPHTNKERLYELCKTIEKHTPLFKIAFKNENNYKTINKLFISTRDIFNFNYSKNTYQYIYRESGTTAIIKSWVLNDCIESPKNISDLLHRLNHNTN